MKIQVALNKKSIQDAIKKVNAVKKMMPKIQQDFLQEVAIWIINRANEYIDRADLGSNVKAELQNHWSYATTASGIKIVNITNVTRKVRSKEETVPLAVLIEFGVGVVGEGKPHPLADEEGYEYNVDSPSKASDGEWHFYANQSDLDLPKSAVNYGLYGHGSRKRMSIYTYGAKGVWYAYNAIVDVKTELAKSNGGEIGELWETVLKRYIK